MTLAPMAAIRGAVATVSLLGLTGVANVGMANAALSETMQPPVHPVVADMQTCSGDGCLASSTLGKRTRATESNSLIQQRVVGQKANLGWEKGGELEADFEDGTSGRSETFLEELEADFEDGTSGRSEEFLETVNTDGIEERPPWGVTKEEQGANGRGFVTQADRREMAQAQQKYIQDVFNQLGYGAMPDLDETPLPRKKPWKNVMYDAPCYGWTTKYACEYCDHYDWCGSASFKPKCAWYGPGHGCQSVNYQLAEMGTVPSSFRTMADCVGCIHMRQTPRGQKKAGDLAGAGPWQWSFSTCMTVENFKTKSRSDRGKAYRACKPPSEKPHGWWKNEDILVTYFCFPPDLSPRFKVRDNMAVIKAVHGKPMKTIPPPENCKSKGAKSYRR